MLTKEKGKFFSVLVFYGKDEKKKNVATYMTTSDQLTKLFVSIAI